MAHDHPLKRVLAQVYTTLGVWTTQPEMEIQVLPGESLSTEQRAEVSKGFEFLGLMAEGGRARKRKGLPLIVPKAEVPKLLRGCGRTPSTADLKELMAQVPDDGIQLEPFLSLYETAAMKPVLDEYQLLDALRTLDLTKTGTLEPQSLKDRFSHLTCSTYSLHVFRVWCSMV